jgi:hypothetical protein
MLYDPGDVIAPPVLISVNSARIGLESNRHVTSY